MLNKAMLIRRILVLRGESDPDGPDLEQERQKLASENTVVQLHYIIERLKATVVDDGFLARCGSQY